MRLSEITLILLLNLPSMHAASLCGRLARVVANHISPSPTHIHRHVSAFLLAVPLAYASGPKRDGRDRSPLLRGRRERPKDAKRMAVAG
ncbi:hypothetical protein B0I35DRAFT_418562 [Stachybotrys elegans]|uniref:Secreted protein n=1 Tax=Stachybotrys elegans TaxID=80388 RepID=A0A8K0WXU5_9HYPO|nr:hypothetical protein B0I35DRAFT_418562 [Stachybotrys elegans]